MKGLLVVAWISVAVTLAQADSPDCRQFRRCSIPHQDWGATMSGSYAFAVDGTFGLRTVDVMNLHGPAEAGYLDAQYPTFGPAAPGNGSYLAEAGGALFEGALVGAGAGLALGIAGSYLAKTLSPNDEMPGLGGFVIGTASGIALGYPCGCVLGTQTVSGWQDCEGNAGRAYAGAYLGMLIAIPVVLLSPPGGAVVAAVLSPAGAVIGYNTGERPVSTRLAPPALAVCTRPGPGQQTHRAFDCRLLTVSF
jgi:hypothetical protein